MRVPPDQSWTVSEQAASASSGSFMRSCRVTLVSRVPNRKEWTRRCFSPSACMKCRKMRVYSLIEPEMSQSTTIGGRTSAPAAVAEQDHVRRRCGGWRERPARIDLARRRRGDEPARRDAVDRQAQSPRSGASPRRSRRRSSARSRGAGAARGRRRRAARRVSTSFPGGRGGSRRRRMASAARAAPARPLRRFCLLRLVDRRRGSSLPSCSGARGFARTGGRPRRRRRDARASSQRSHAASSRSPRACRLPATSTARTASTTEAGPTGCRRAASARAK